jgi:protein gp37
VGKTSIEWTERTINPIRARNRASGKVGWHCEHVTDACKFCYAEALNLRVGTQLPFKPGHFDNNDVEVFFDEEMAKQLLHWRDPAMIFVCSMTDLFGDFVMDEWIDKVFALMCLTPHHTYQILTKRPTRMQAYFQRRAAGVLEWLWHYSGNDEAMVAWPPPNVWAGVSVGDQKDADDAIPRLCRVLSSVRFLSCEPLLGPIDLRLEHREGIGWVIVGGESGKHARPCEIDNIRSIVKQCQHHKVPVFVKQLGQRPTLHGFTGYPTTDRKGGNINDFPEDLKVREWPNLLQRT